MRYAKDNGFDLSIDYEGNKQEPSAFDFHITIFYTTSTHNINDDLVKINPIKLTPSKLDLLGKEKNVPVISISPNKELLNLRNLFIEQGFKDAWPNYKPHISLSYRKQQYNLSNIPLPDFSIIVDGMTIKNQNE